MEISTLLHWRRIVPGAMFAVVIAPYFLPLLDMLAAVVLSKSESADYLKALSVAIFLVMGHVYDASAVRWKLKASDQIQTREAVDARLRQTLMLFGARAREIEEWDRREKSWTRLLYRIVDSDPTLVVMSKRIYDAGFNWSSFIDGSLILLYGGLLFLTASVIWGRSAAVIYYLSIVALGIFAQRSIARQALTHRKLCLEQQDHILYFCGVDLVRDFRVALNA